MDPLQEARLGSGREIRAILSLVYTTSMSTPNSSSAVASAAAAQPQKSIFAPGLFKDVVFLITGGGTGIGKAVAVEAVQLGAKVALCGRRQPPLSEAAAELAKISSPDRVYFETCTYFDSFSFRLYQFSEKRPAKRPRNSPLSCRLRTEFASGEAHVAIHSLAPSAITV